MRPLFPLGMLLATALTRPVSSQRGDRLLEGILLAEDHRAAASAERQLLLRALSSDDPELLRRASRALGRLERPELAGRILPLLAHPLPEVRAEAAQAVAQAVQGFRGDSAGSERGDAWRATLAALGQRVPLERDPDVRGMLALSLGRLPYAAPQEIVRAREWLLALEEGTTAVARVAVARGLETHVRLTVRRVPLSETLVARLRRLAGGEGPDWRPRLHALGALLAGQSADPATLTLALGAGEPQLRRLALTGVARLGDREMSERLLRTGLADSAGLVRYEAIRMWARFAGPAACPELRGVARDTIPGLALLALDLLGTGCAGDSAAVDLLAGALADSGGGWQRAAHALVSIARLAPARAAGALPGALAARDWQRRMYAARAALILRDAGALRRLATDPVANVREAALAALRDLSGYAGDSLYRAALASSDYQLVLTAANALAGTRELDATTRALFLALGRITRERRETSRDPRIAILVRLRELAGPAVAPRLVPYLRDFDPAVADSAAALLTRWTGRTHRAAPRRLAPAPVSLAEIERLRGKRLRFTMESGATFEVELLADAAPLTVLRVARLAARGFYDGLSFHRVVPNFVIQGGSPGANEYAGDRLFMRDELGPLSHQRGTLGVSTRGRDTGDAQPFINLVDNPRLDYDYTVWGRVVSGMRVVDAVLEGDVIARVELRSP